MCSDAIAYHFFTFKTKNLLLRIMWFRPEMSSIFYVESNCETVKVIKNEVNDMFILKQVNDILMTNWLIIVFLNIIIDII